VHKESILHPARGVPVIIQGLQIGFSVMSVVIGITAFALESIIARRQNCIPIHVIFASKSALP
jgi:hypothetical protein